MPYNTYVPNALKLLWKNHPQRLILCGLVLLVCLQWGRSLTFDFLWDDQYYIVFNEALNSPENALDLLTKAEAQKSVPPYPYRPLRTLHYGLLSWLPGPPLSAVFHGANILWHLASTLLIYALFSKLLGRREKNRKHVLVLAALCAGAFAVHPIVSELVPWAKSLDDLMATCFMLAACLAAFKAWELPQKTHALWALASLVCFLAALGSKESTAALVLIFLFCLSLRPKQLYFWIWFIAQYAIAMAFLSLRHQVLGQTAQVTVPVSGTYAQTLLDMVPVVLLYMRAFIGFGPFHPDYSFLSGGFAWYSPWVLAGAATIFLGLAALVWSWKRNVLVCLGLMWLVLALAPVSNIIPMMQYYAERFAYLPLIGFLLVVAGLAVSLNKYHKQVVIGLIALLIAWSGNAWLQTAKWQNESTLWSYAYAHSPASKRIVTNYLISLYSANQGERFIKQFEQHAKLISQEPRGKWLAANYAMLKGRTKEALAQLEALREDLEYDPEFMIALGVAYAKANQAKEALELFEQVTAHWPQFASAWINQGLVLNDLRRYKDAIDILEQGLAYEPEDIQAWKGLSQAAWMVQDWPLARKALQKLALLEPHNPDHLYWLDKLRKEQLQNLT